MLLKEFIKGDDLYKEFIEKTIKEKNIAPGLYEEANIIELLEKGEYNYYRMKFDHSLSMKWLFENIKNFIKDLYNEYKERIKLFTKTSFSKDFQYYDGKSLIFIELNDKVRNGDELKVHLLQINEELKKEQDTENNINLYSNETLNSNR